MPRQKVSTLWVDTITVQSVPIDWSESLGEDMEGWQSWEAFHCDECGKVVVVDRLGECQHSEIDEGRCDGYLNAEGPMMSYYYPLPDLRGGNLGGDPAEAAGRLVDLPLCVVEIDGEYALALTGGGMDLSWEICEAFMLLGYLPPYRFTDLPNMAGYTLNARRRWVLAGCRRTAQVMAEWGKRRSRQLTQTRRRMAEEPQRQAA